MKEEQGSRDKRQKKKSEVKRRRDKRRREERCVSKRRESGRLKDRGGLPNISLSQKKGGYIVVMRRYIIFQSY